MIKPAAAKHGRLFQGLDVAAMTDEIAAHPMCLMSVAVIARGQKCQPPGAGSSHRPLSHASLSLGARREP